MRRRSESSVAVDGRESSFLLLIPMLPPWITAYLLHPTTPCLKVATQIAAVELLVKTLGLAFSKRPGITPTPW